MSDFQTAYLVDKLLNGASSHCSICSGKVASVLRSCLFEVSHSAFEFVIELR